MSWRPGLVASDLDGTLLDERGQVSRVTAAAVARIEAAGVPFVIVTGRPPRWLHDVAEQLDHRGVAVCSNGALVYDLHTETILDTDPLTPAVLGEATAALRAALPEAMFAVEYGESLGHEPAYRPAEYSPRTVAGELADLVSRPAVKLLVRHPGQGADDLLASSRTILGDSVTLTHSAGDGLLEISAAGVTKASGLARVAQRHGVPAADVVAFGDMPNDLPMFAWAGYAIAMANAHPEVLAAATDVTGSNAEHGVATYLDRWFPPGRG